MKTKILYRFAMALTITGVMFAACKKDNNNSSSGQSTADIQTQSDDQSQADNEQDGIANDVNTTLTAQETTVTGGGGGPRNGIAVQGNKPDTVKTYICDAIVVRDTVSNPRTLTITYNGSNCNGTRTRTGTVVISWAPGTVWKNKGAQVTVTVNNLKITRIKDGKSITLNGSHLYTNVSGGSLIDLPKLGSITHTIVSSDMSITFDNGSKRSWQVARQRIYTYNNGIVITTTGTHTDGNTTGIIEWGTNRFGNSFTAVINQPLVISQSCNFQMTAGSIEVIRPEVTTTLTFGLDSTGTPIGCTDAGYYFKLVWEGAGGKTYTFILPY